MSILWVLAADVALFIAVAAAGLLGTIWWRKA